MKLKIFQRAVLAVSALAMAGAPAIGRADDHQDKKQDKQQDKQEKKQDQQDKKMACCCDCLGCTSAAYPAPELSSVPAELPARVHYEALTLLLSGRALLPEPDPPRPGPLI